MEGDEVLLARPMRIENKQVFVDLKQVSRKRSKLVRSTQFLISLATTTY